MSSRVPRSAVVVLSVGAALCACRNGSPPTVATDSTGARAAASASDPGTTASAADAAGPLVKACLMVNVCSCNLGCATIRLPGSQISEGSRARVESGPLTGEEVKIVEVVDASGARVLALTDLHHDHACSLPSDRALLGYGCEANKSGPVPVRACTRGCD